MHRATGKFNSILCIRADNMGDVIMSGPAIRALKQTFGARITLLSSRMGSLIAPCVPEVDDCIVADLPWVKTGSSPSAGDCFVLTEKLRSLKFDLAVIFTVYSQSALPAALLAFLAGIPRRLAYCRENPYHLLTDWVPDKEPYAAILHQVERDLALVEAIGAQTANEKLHLRYTSAACRSAIEKAVSRGLDPKQPWITIHPGVSDPKREYPPECWIRTARLLHKELGIQLAITGSANESSLVRSLSEALPFAACTLAGVFSVEELVAFVGRSALVISVNTATAHIATALDRPLVVLYARTNPQHTPWKGRSEVLYFSGEPSQSSRNEVIRWVQQQLYTVEQPYPSSGAVLSAAQRLLGFPVPAPSNIRSHG